MTTPLKSLRAHSADEAAVKVASKLYEARDTMKTLCPFVYRQQIEKHQQVIRELAEKSNCNAFIVLQRLLEKLQAEHRSEYAQLWLMAAYVEMIEPTK